MSVGFCTGPEQMSKRIKKTEQSWCPLLAPLVLKETGVAGAAAATGGYVEFDRPFTHLCVFPFSGGGGRRTEREREREREGGRGVWWKSRGGGE